MLDQRVSLEVFYVEESFELGGVAVHTWQGWMCDQERGRSMCSRGPWDPHAFCSVLPEAERILECKISPMHITLSRASRETYL